MERVSIYQGELGRMLAGIAERRDATTSQLVVDIQSPGKIELHTNPQIPALVIRIYTDGDCRYAEISEANYADGQVVTSTKGAHQITGQTGDLVYAIVSTTTDSFLPPGGVESWEELKARVLENRRALTYHIFTLR